jgi:hypothetical protein
MKKLKFSVTGLNISNLQKRSDVCELSFFADSRSEAASLAHAIAEEKYPFLKIALSGWRMEGEND